MAKAYDFRSVEMKETARRIDGVLIPKEPGRLLFFTEIQFYKLESIYAEIMAKAFMFLAQNDPGHPFLAVVIFGSRSFEPTGLLPYGGLMQIALLRPIFLEEIPDAPGQSLGLSILRLIVKAEAETMTFGRELVVRVGAEIGDEAERVNLIELIGEAVIRKLSNLTRQEVEAMLGLHDIRETRVYQDAREEGRDEEKVRMVGKLAENQFPPERIAEMVAIDIAKVRELLAKKNG